MTATLPRMIASAWWGQGNTRALVLIMTALAALDSGYTAMWIGQRGLIGEANPLIKSLFEVGLGPVWGIVNVLVTFLGAIFLGSCVVVLQGRGRAYPVLGMSLLAALKIVLALYHLIQVYNILEFVWILWIAGAVTFVSTRELLYKGRLFDSDQAAHLVRQLRSDLSTFVIFSRAPKTKPTSSSLVPIRASKPKSDRASILRDRRLFFWLGVIVLAPILGLSVVEFLLRVSGVLDLPSWMRGLGIVSEQQGRLFLVALVTILLTIAVLIYSIVAVFEILSNETTKKKRQARKRDERSKLVGLLVVPLFLVSCWTAVPVPALASSSLDAAVAPAGSIPASPELAAALDSRGRIHAAWVEQDNDFSHEANAHLLYSVYDPETTRARTAHLLDSSPSIYSLSMAIDEFDRAHIVWTSESAEITDLREETTQDEQRLENAVYYITMNAGEATSSSPKLLVDSRAEALWTAIAVGQQSQLYLVWTEIDRLGSADVETQAYYARLDKDDDGANLTCRQFASRSGSSRLLKATSSADHSSLHLAWIEESFDNRSRIMYSRVDLLQDNAIVRDIEDVDGMISRLALARAKDGEVVIGWAYREPSRNERIARVARLSDQGEIRKIETGVRADYATDPESMTVDSEGNLHLMWMDYGDSIQRGPKPPRGSQPTYYHMKLSSDWQSQEQEELVSSFSTGAAFVLDNGQVYAVSQWGLFQVTKPVWAREPSLFLFLLVAFASVLTAASTEAGTYGLARWTAAPKFTRTVVESQSSELRGKLLRRMRRRPGVTLSDLKSMVQCSAFSIAYQLRLLESSGAIRSLREGTRQRFYCLISDDQRKSHAHELRRSVLLLVQTEPGITEAQIAKHLGTSQQLTNYHLRLLSKSKLLSSMRTSGRVNYFVNERMLPRVKETTDSAECAETSTCSSE